jgi:hypothetical protein
MHTVELLQQLLQLAEQMGYGIRHEWLGGANGGLCEINGKRWIFVDVSLNPLEQLDQVTRALSQDAGLHGVSLPAALRTQFDLGRAA